MSSLLQNRNLKLWDWKYPSHSFTIFGSSLLMLIIIAWYRDCPCSSTDLWDVTLRIRRCSISSFLIFIICKVVLPSYMCWVYKPINEFENSARKLCGQFRNIINEAVLKFCGYKWSCSEILWCTHVKPKYHPFHSSFPWWNPMTDPCMEYLPT